MRRSCLLATLAVTLAIAVASCGGGDDAPAYEEPTGPAVASLSFTAENFEFTPDTAKAPAGIIEMDLESTSGAHDLVIEGIPGFELDTPGSGDTASAKVDLKKGKYTFYCTLSGHRAAGMEGTLTIG